MKKWKKVLLFILLLMVCAFTVPSACQAKPMAVMETEKWDSYEVVTSGRCGKNVSYKMYKTGKDTYALQLYGTGRTDDYTDDDSFNFQYTRPWDGTKSNPAEYVYLLENNVTEIEVGEGITYIGSAAFADFWNPNLKVFLPSTLKGIGNYAFFSCKLHEINIPNKVELIGNHAFADCSNIKLFTLPDSLTQLGKASFSGMESLQKLDNWNDKITEIPDSLLCKTAINDFTVPDAVTRIGRNVFSGCQNLTRVNWNDKVKEIGDMAFCSSGLESMVIPDTVEKVGERVFSDCRNLKNMALGKGQKGILGASSFYNCITLSKIEISDQITGIADAAFYNCISMESVEIPDSVTRIGKKAFYGCKSLEQIHLPKGIKVVNDAAFRGCGMLRSIKLPDSVTKIGKEAFYGSNLHAAVLPDKVNSIGANAFKNCKKLTMVKLGKGIKTIHKSAFTSCVSLKEIRVPKKKYKAYKEILKLPLSKLKKVKIAKY